MQASTTTTTVTTTTLSPQVFFHSYEYKNQRGMLQVLLMVNAGRARLYRALCELEQMRWMRRENHAGHPPPRPFKIPEDFKVRGEVRGRRVEDEEEGGGSGGGGGGGGREEEPALCCTNVLYNSCIYSYSVACGYNHTSTVRIR